MPEVLKTVGRYEVLREVGRGGMAQVYLARQTDLDRFVALKELGAFHASDPSFAQRFLRESRVAGSLSHPNIVTVHDYFEHDGTPYIAMEYVERGSLRPYIGRLELAQIGGVLEGLLAGLAAAEQHGIVHRDLKPENLMVTSDGRVKIADFGIAKATTRMQTGAFLTATGTTVGTPTYMAPEQAMAQQVGPWTDLYSVGCMAYELFVGRVPFHDSEAPMAILLRHVNEPIAPARTVADVDPEISDWIDRLLVKDPAARTQSANEAWEDLEELIIGLLGPRWRRGARLVEPAGPAGAGLRTATPKPLTPAPFEGAPDGPAEGEPSDEFQSFAWEGAAPPPGPATPPPGPGVAPLPEPVVGPPTPLPGPAVPAEAAASVVEGGSVAAPTGDVAAPAPSAGDVAPPAPSAAPAGDVAPPAPAPPPADSAPPAAAVSDASGADDSGFRTFVPPGAAPSDAAAPPPPVAPTPAAAAPAPPAAPDVAPPAAAAAPPPPAAPPVDLAPPPAPAAPPVALAPAAAPPPPLDPPPPAPPADDAALESAPTVLPDAVERPWAEDEPERESRGGRTALLVVLAAVVVLGVVGFLVGGSGGDENGQASSSGTPAAKGQLVSGDAVAFTPPAGWRRLDDPPAIPGLELTGGVAAAKGGSADGPGFVAGAAPADADNFTLLPAGFLAAAGIPSERPAVELADGVPAFRYTGVRPEGFDGPLTVYALQTADGAINAACFGADVKTCDAVASTLELQGASALPLGPGAAYAKTLDRTLGRLDRARTSGRRSLARARDNRRYATAADGLAGAYGSAAATLRGAGPQPADVSVNGVVVDALQRGQAAYRTLANTARRNNRGGFPAARRAVTRADAQVREALAALEKAGYDVRS